MVTREPKYANTLNLIESYSISKLLTLFSPIFIVCHYYPFFLNLVLIHQTVLTSALPPSKPFLCFVTWLCGITDTSNRTIRRDFHDVYGLERSPINTKACMISFQYRNVNKILY